MAKFQPRTVGRHAGTAGGVRGPTGPAWRPGTSAIRRSDRMSPMNRRTFLESAAAGMGRWRCRAFGRVPARRLVKPVPVNRPARAPTSWSSVPVHSAAGRPCTSGRWASTSPWSTPTVRGMRAPVPVARRDRFEPDTPTRSTTRVGWSTPSRVGRGGRWSGAARSSSRPARFNSPRSGRRVSRRRKPSSIASASRPTS